MIYLLEGTLKLMILTFRSRVKVAKVIWAKRAPCSEKPSFTQFVVVILIIQFQQLIANSTMVLFQLTWVNGHAVSTLNIFTLHSY